VDRNIYSQNLCLKPGISMETAEKQMLRVIDRLNAAFDRFERERDARRLAKRAATIRIMREHRT
jgi:hypothetical protein